MESHFLTQAWRARWCGLGRQTAAPFFARVCCSPNPAPLEPPCNLSVVSCAELVAACLQVGGLFSSCSNPGAATPHSLFKMYSKVAAATANPYLLRSFQTQTRDDQIRIPLLREPTVTTTAFAPARRRTDSPPRASFRVLNQSAPRSKSGGFTLSLTSLSTNPKS